MTRLLDLIIGSLVASVYNASPWSVRPQLEEEYISKKSVVFDLLVLGKAVQALIASRGNVKARGVPLAHTRESFKEEE